MKTQNAIEVSEGVYMTVVPINDELQQRGGTYAKSKESSVEKVVGEALRADLFNKVVEHAALASEKAIAPIRKLEEYAPDSVELEFSANLTGGGNVLIGSVEGSVGMKVTLVWKGNDSAL